MKKLSTLIFAVIILLTCFSQVTTTTSSGKTVILKTDGTWKYADGSKIDENPCSQFHTGNLTIKNNTDKDIYFYYHFQSIYSIGASVAKVKAKSSKTISSLSSGLKETYGTEQYKYGWKATLEAQSDNVYIKQMEGIENGEFVITDCESVEIEVDN